MQLLLVKPLLGLQKQAAGAPVGKVTGPACECHIVTVMIVGRCAWARPRDVHLLQATGWLEQQFSWVSRSAVSQVIESETACAACMHCY